MGLSRQQLFFENIVLYIFLMFGLIFPVIKFADLFPIKDKSIYGISGDIIFYYSIIAACIFQTYVWLAWRSVLHYKINYSFYVHIAVFFSLFIPRIITIVLVAQLDQNSIELPFFVVYVIRPVFAALQIYGSYSTIVYFGPMRLTGSDHFYEEHRKIPLVNEGMFKYSDNVMYTYVSLFNFVITISYSSKIAFFLAIFHYISPWIHFYCIEKPDIREIYGISLLDKSEVDKNK